MRHHYCTEHLQEPLKRKGYCHTISGTKKESEKALTIDGCLEKISIFSMSKDEVSNYALIGRVYSNKILMLIIFNGFCILSHCENEISQCL